MDSLQTAGAYLAALTSGIPERLYSYIWLKSPDGAPSKKTATHSFVAGTPVETMAKLAIDSMHSYDVYFGMGIASTKLARQQRLKQGERDAAGITALWCDIDFGDSGHKKDRLPQNEDEALAMLDPVFDDCPPSMAVQSGGGYHVYWLLDAPLLTGGDLDPRELLRRWNNYLQDVARRGGYVLDSMKDLERVLRIPGTLNHKPGYGTPRPVKLVINEPHIRYAAADLWRKCERFSLGTVADTKNVAREKAPAIPADGLVVDERRPINHEKWEVLSDNSLRFRQTWKHNRHDIDESLDSSASVYEWHLAMMMVGANWTDQEIIDGITAWRKKHGFDPVERPLHYFINQTIPNARSGNGGGNLPPPPVDTASGGFADDEGLSEAAKAAARESLGRLLGLERAGVKLLRIRRYDGKEPYFYIETSRGDIEMGVAGNMAAYDPCQKRLFGAGYNVIAARDQWGVVKDLMIAVTEAQAIPEVQTTGLVLGLLDEYLSKRPLMSNVQEAEETKDPFLHNGARCIFLRAFVSWCNLEAPNEKLAQGDVANALKAAGLVGFQVPVKDEKGKATKRYAWRYTAADDDDPQEITPESEPVAHVA